MKYTYEETIAIGQADQGRFEQYRDSEKSVLLQRELTKAQFQQSHIDRGRDGVGKYQQTFPNIACHIFQTKLMSGQEQVSNSNRPTQAAAVISNQMKIACYSGAVTEDKLPTLHVIDGISFAGVESTQLTDNLAAIASLANKAKSYHAVLVLLSLPTGPVSPSQA